MPFPRVAQSPGQRHDFLMPPATTETARVPEDISGRPRRLPVGGITWRHTFRALRHRNYRLFFWGQLVSLIGTWMQQTAMSWFVYQITNSKLLLGTVAAVGSAPMMLFSIWGGSLADLYPKRSIIIATQTAQMICAFLLAAGAWAGFATPSFIIIIAALNGVAMGFDMPARQAFTVEMASREDLLNAISLNSSIVNGALNSTAYALGGGFISARLTGAGAVTQDGVGTTTLAATNTYTGGTAINSGKLEAAHASVGAIDALGSGGITINSGGALRSSVNGTLGNGITFNDGSFGTLSAAAGTTLTLTGGIFLNPDSATTFGSSTDTGTVLADPTGISPAGRRAGHDPVDYGERRSDAGSQRFQRRDS